MSIVYAIALALGGLATAFFGLRIYISLLPVLMAILGGILGLRLGTAITGDPVTTSFEGNNWLGIGLAVVLALVFGAVSFTSFKDSKFLVGALAGGAIGFAIASYWKMSTVPQILIAVVGAIVLGLVALFVYEAIIMVATALSGSAAFIDGLHLIFPDFDFFKLAQLDNRTTGSTVAFVLWLVIGLVGAIFQFSQQKNWIKEEKPAEPTLPGISSIS